MRKRILGELFFKDSFSETLILTPTTFFTRKIALLELYAAAFA